MPDPVVGLHPHKAAVLAAALRDTAAELRGAAQVLVAALVAGADDPALAAPVGRTADWAAEQAGLLQWIVDEVAQAELQGRSRALEGIDVWRTPYDRAFDDPRAAARGWAEARALLASDLLESGAVDGDRDSDHARSARRRLGDLLGVFAHDPVFAGELAAALPPDRVATLLQLQAERLRSGAGDDASRAASGLREAVFGLLGVASASGALRFGVADLVRALRSDEREAGSVAPGVAAPLGLLFTPDSVWSPVFLVDAVRELVVPLNRSGGERQVPQRIGGEDPRLGLLAAVGRSPEAARVLIAGGSLPDLVADRFAYGDNGAAVAAVLAAGTDPSAPGAAEQAAANMASFVAFATHHHDLPPVVRARLGVITAPWVPCFRSVSRDHDPAAANPLVVLTEASRLDYLAVVASDPVAMVDLRRAELWWAAASLYSGAGAGFGPGGIALVSNVDARVATAVHTGLVDHLDAEADRIAFDKRVWSVIVAAFTAFVPGVGTPLSIGLETVGEIVDPVPEWALDHARTFPKVDQSNRAKLETLLLASLWARRAENHVFDDLEAPPSTILVGEPPRLLFAPEMTAAQLDDFRAWVERTHLRRRAHFEELTVGAG